MNKDVSGYIKFWSEKKAQLQREIATKKRSLEQAEERLSNPEFHLKRELNRGGVKASKAIGIERVQKPKTVLKKNSVVNERVEIPTVEMDLPPAGVAAPASKEEKTSWTFFK